MMTNFTKKWAMLVAAVMVLAFSAQAQTVFFSEDFNGGLGAYTAGPGAPVGAVWEHSTNGTAAANQAGTINALFWGTRTAINSPSVANGCAMYNSDVYDGGGTAVGGGAYPGTHSGDMVSPSYDLTGKNDVSLKFNQYARANANAVSTLLDVSIDGGMTWINFPINAEVVGNASNNATNDGVVIVDLSAVAGGQSDVKIRFSWTGRYYFWLVDDVELIEKPNNDLVIGDYFYSADNFGTPITQIGTDTFGFSVDITNNGAADASNVVVRASVTDDALNTIWIDSVTVPTIPAGYEDSTIDFVSTFVPDQLAVGSYFIVYSVSSDSVDFAPANNQEGYAFEINDSTFQKHSIIESGVRPGGGGDYMMGNVYTTSDWNPTDTKVSATNIYFTCAKNAADGALDGNTVVIWLAEVSANVDANWDNFDATADLSTNPDLTTVGFATYVFPTGAANYDDFIITIEDLINGGKEVELKPNTRYMLLADYNGTNNLIFGATDNTIKLFQISTILYNAGWFLGGFGEDRTAVLSTNIKVEDLTSNTNNQELTNASMEVFPNPATSFVNININFDEATDATLFITDVTGKLVQTQALNNVTNEKVNINVSDLAAGTYIARITTAEGFKTERFVVVK